MQSFEILNKSEPVLLKTNSVDVSREDSRPACGL